MKKYFSYLFIALISASLGWLARGYLVSIPPVETPPTENYSLLFPPQMAVEAPATDHRPTTSTQPDKQQLQQWLEQGDYENAVQLYVQAYTVGNDNDAIALRNIILIYLSNELSTQNFNNVIALADIYLRAFFDDFDVLLVKADALTQQGKLQAAVFTFYDALDTYPAIEIDKEIRQHVHELVLQEDKKLRQRHDLQTLSDFYQQLLLRESNYVPYFLYYADTLINLKHYASAREQLLNVRHHEQFAEISKKMLHYIEVLESGGSVVNLDRDGQHYLVNTTIGHSTPTVLLIDTGASVSTLSPEKFRQLDPAQYALVSNDLVLSTANGKTSVSVYRVNRLQLDKHILRDVDIAVLPMDSSFGADGLLGMNVLSHFHFEIDQANARLILEPQ